MISLQKQNTFTDLCSYILCITFVVAIICLFFFDSGDVLYNTWHFERESFSQTKLTSITYIFFHSNLIQLSINLASLLLIFIFLGKIFESIWWIPALLFSGVSASYGVYFYDLDTNLLCGLSAPIHGLIFYAILYLRISIVWIIALFLKLFIDLYFDGIFVNFLNNFIYSVDMYTTSPLANIFALFGAFIAFFLSRSISTISLLIELIKHK